MVTSSVGVGCTPAESLGVWACGRGLMVAGLHGGLVKGIGSYLTAGEQGLRMRDTSVPVPWQTTLVHHSASLQAGYPSESFSVLPGNDG